MAHDIIDNRELSLLDELAKRFPSSERAKFAVGYFFLSGLESVRESLYNLKELRLLIGNTTNRQTIEQISEGYRRLEPVREAIDAERYPKRTEIKAQVAATVEDVRGVAESMEQTDADQELVQTLVRMIAEERLKVRVYTQGRLHAKAYIFDALQTYDDKGRALPKAEPGVAIVGSSNFTLSGISHNTELNVVVHGSDNHARLTQWFEDLWQDGEPFDAALMAELTRSWAMAQPTPYDIYMKTLYGLVQDRLDDSAATPFLWNDDVVNILADFQRVAVRQAIQTIERYNGCFVADVVGLGKSYIGAAIVKHFEHVERARPLIICPKPLEAMWQRYNEVYHLNAHVLSMSLLRESNDGGKSLLLDDVRYRDRDFVLVDESHNFRNPDAQRYRVLQEYLASAGRRCVLLTATPRTRNAWDIYHQMRLFHPGDTTTLPVEPPHLGQYFEAVERGARSLPELLSHILIRRTRAHIIRWYGLDAETHQRIVPEDLPLYRANKKRAYVEVGGRKQSFPRRELQTLEYSIEATYAGLYDRLRVAMGGADDPVAGSGQRTLRYARYGIGNYVVASKRKQAQYAELQQTGANLRGLMRTMLFKRFESSVHAFRETIRRMIGTHRAFARALGDGIIPAGEDASTILRDAESYDDVGLVAALKQVAKPYPVADFKLAALESDIAHDIEVLEEISALVAPIDVPGDAKLQRLVAHLATQPDRKLLIFTQYADTASYVLDALNPGAADPSIAAAWSSDSDKMRLVARFSPRSNPQIPLRSGDTPIRILVTTDVLSEGLNLQDCDTVINYDLHWNPVRLIQRFGRIDRIGTEYETIYGVNFLPERALEEHLGLQEILQRRIREIHETIGEDAAVLEPGEALNETAMYAIYAGGDTAVLDDEEDTSVGLNEAEELLRQLRTDDPAEYQRIAELRNGVRTGRYGTTKGRVVFCRAGVYQQLMLLDDQGEIVSRDIPTILGLLRAALDEPGMPVDPGHNQAVARVKAAFAQEAEQRRIEQQQTERLTLGQRYVRRELSIAYAQTTDPDLQAQIDTLEKAFRRPQSKVAQTELNGVRRAELTGTRLVEELTALYRRFGLDKPQSTAAADTTDQTPMIVCSEVIV